MDSIPEGKRVDKTLLEEICRLICTAQGVDPDKKGWGLGHLMPKDTVYKLWEARQREAQAILDAGWKPSRRKKK